MNTTARYFGKTRSGVPGKDFRCNRYRNPSENNAFRSTTSGFVFCLLMFAMQRCRCSGVKTSMELLCAQHAGNDICHLQGEKRRDRVPYLPILIGARALKEIVVWEGLDACGFPNRPAPALRRVMMNEVVAVFANVARHCSCRLVLDLYSEPIIKKPMPIP